MSAGITPGEWIADVRSGCVAVYQKDREGDTPGCHHDDERNIHYSSKGSKYNGMCWEMDEQAVNDALLFAEAGTVTNETGLTPRQLADENAKMKAFMRKFANLAEGLENGNSGCEDAAATLTRQAAELIKEKS